MAFHEILFPLSVALGATGGPERRTEIVALASGREERNAVWAGSRRRYDAGTALLTLDDVQTLIAFFEARMGRLHGFRWRDAMDDRSCMPSAAPGPFDQAIGTGDGIATVVPLVKTYASGGVASVRAIEKPVAGTVRVAVAGVEQASGWSVDPATGRITFAAPPPEGAAITAGYRFDVPVRFDTDHLAIDLAAFRAGRVPSIPVVEIRP